MCGGAIISDLIGPMTVRPSRRVTADFLWPDLKNRSSCKSSEVINLDDDFEAGFKEFKDEESDEEEELDVKPYVFSAAPPLAESRSPGISRETPRASPRGLVKVDSHKSLPKANLKSVQPHLDQNFYGLNNPDLEYYGNMGFFEEKPPTNQFGCQDTFPANGDVGVKSISSSGNTPMYFNSEQGSNSLDCTDYGWGEKGPRTPEISSAISALEGDDMLFMEDANPKKKLKSSSEEVVPVAQQNSSNSLSDELMAFDSQMKLLPISSLEESWDAGLDSFLNGDSTQEGANLMDLWNFDDLSSMQLPEGVF
ncbi:hypothetical protein HS088_TW18G00778 [Tripterygium wilfordii]|uniref:Ethylene-responsive transcription factor RAP2-12-like n=1 Tax=Tripterygium wilfordii TaxID=458696 RepID=A0A7J7CD75_TRIWF|nr:hypothetical protein HS088_TW18G00778 [Tripterygium wilfordii]